jgi:site-specific DNA-methyltransferase (cytosine-N4-specific)
MTDPFLARIAAELRRIIAAATKLDGRLVECDITARRHEANAAKRWANSRERIKKQLEKLGITEAEWCKRHLGCDINTMRRRLRLLRGWKQYESARRAAGDTGQYGLLYALSLVQAAPTTIATRGHRLSVRSGSGVGRLDVSRCQFVTGEALAELRKMKSKTVSAAISSPPYWPLKRRNDGRGAGYERKLEDYIAHLVEVFRETRRVLRDNGVFWIVIGDSYVKSAGVWDRDPKTAHTAGLMRQDTTYLRPVGNLLMIPARLAMALQDDGWYLRQEVIWDKGWCRPENVTDRMTRTHEFVFMFSKRRRYFYDPDPIREPLITTPTKRKLSVIDNDRDTAFRIYENPMGRNSGSVWHIPPSEYRGRHDATFPSELVRRMLAVSCDDLDSDVLVLDPFGGAGTTAMVALQNGYRAVTIDINSAATNEARERLAEAPANFPANDPVAENGPALAAD